MRLVIATLLLAACGSKDPKPAPAPTVPTCTQVDATIDAMIEKKKSPDGTLAPDRKARLEKLRTALSTRCTADSWPVPMLECLKTVTAQPDLMVCMSNSLTPDQQGKLQNDIMQAMTGGRPPGSGSAH